MPLCKIVHWVAGRIWSEFMSDPKVGETHGHLMSHDESDKRVTKQ